jgi:hypothetical protein
LTGTFMSINWNGRQVRSKSRIRAKKGHQRSNSRFETSLHNDNPRIPRIISNVFFQIILNSQLTTWSFTLWIRRRGDSSNWVNFPEMCPIHGLGLITSKWLPSIKAYVKIFHTLVTLTNLKCQYFLI